MNNSLRTEGNDANSLCNAAANKYGPPQRALEIRRHPRPLSDDSGNNYHHGNQRQSRCLRKLCYLLVSPKCERAGSLTFAISRYKERGYEIPRTNITMTARLFVKSQRKGMSEREGKMAAITWGIVSPTMMQNAIMPPNALERH